MATAASARPSLDRPDLYLPQLARVLDVREEVAADANTRRVVTLSLERGGMDWRPGQFVQVGVFGAGEVPICISSPPGLRDALMITVRDAGLVSGMITQLKPGAVLGLRGPCGNGFSLDAHFGRDLLFVAGGMGLPALRGLLWQALLQRSDFGRIVLLHGSRCPGELLYTWQHEAWEKQGVEVMLSADRGDGCWEHQDHPPRCVGLITALFDKVGITGERTSAFLCGPAIMIEIGGRELVQRLKVPAHRCVTTLERHMKCGVGKCGHCIVVDRYVCVDGPVFHFDELSALARVEAPW
jgi:NAD(P)H-flavin reductase